MIEETNATRYATTVNTFNSVADQYLAYFKDFKLYQPSYDWLLDSINSCHKKVLEIACGPGQVSHYLLQRNPELEISGIDLAPKMIELARKLNPSANYQVMDCRQITQLAAEFDVIMCGFCLAYLSFDDSIQLIKDMSSMLASSGILYLSTTSSNEPDGYQSSNSAYGRIYVHYHNINDIKGALETSGLQVFNHEKIIHQHNDKETVDEFIMARKI